MAIKTKNKSGKMSSEEGKDDDNLKTNEMVVTNNPPIEVSCGEITCIKTDEGYTLVDDKGKLPRMLMETMTRGNFQKIEVLTFASKEEFEAEKERNRSVQVTPVKGNAIE